MILPSILSADFSRLGSEIGEVLNGGGDFLHLDIMDGHFVPNISFGPHVTEATRKSTPAYLDCHLMISDPLKYAAPLIKAGANSITFHVEAVVDPIATAKELKRLGCHVGITLRPATAVESILPALDWVDLVLIMSVVPGFSGQKFMPEVLPKAAEVKSDCVRISVWKLMAGSNPKISARPPMRASTGSWSPARSSTRKTGPVRSRR